MQNKKIMSKKKKKTAKYLVVKNTEKKTAKYLVVKNTDKRQLFRKK